jgi:hypothetical protein
VAMGSVFVVRHDPAINASGRRSLDHRCEHGLGTGWPPWREVLRLVDSTPVLCGVSRETV